MEGYKLIFKGPDFKIWQKGSWFVMEAANGQTFPMGLDEVKRYIKLPVAK